MREQSHRKNERRSISMKSIWITILLSGIALAGTSSCAMMPKTPLVSGEVRLLSMNVVGGALEEYSSFAVNIFYETGGNAEIKRACFYESWKWSYCFDVSDRSYFTFGTKRGFQVWLPGIHPGSHRVECYVEYIRDGEIRRTNVIFTQIVAHASRHP